MTEADLGALAAWTVSYPSAGRTLAGYLFVPEGEGPFPAMVVNHGSAGLRPNMRDVGEAFTAMRYAAFVPVRRGYHGNPGPNWRTHVSAADGSDAWGAQLVQALVEENDDVLAGCDWLASQPRIDGARIGITGTSFGGIMTLLAIGRTDRFRAAVNFAAAAMTWERAPALQDALLDAVRRTETSLMLIQAANDYSLAPTYALGAELAQRGKPHESRVYPPHGDGHGAGHALFTTGIATWRADVQAFLARWMGTA